MKELNVFTLYSEKGASSQYRAYIFKEILEKQYSVKWFAFWNDKYVTKYIHNKKKYWLQILVQYVIAVIKRWYQLNFVAPNADIVFIQKGTIPKSKYVYLKKIKNKNARIVFDVDDAIYTIPNDNSHKIAAVADCVICGNETLKEYYKRFNKNCFILPTVENTFKYSPFWDSTFEKKTIGWIGSKTTLNNLNIVVSAINNVISRHPEVEFQIISNTALDYSQRIKNTSLVEWDKEKYISNISNFTIGIMPLYDNAMNRGKCGFKLVQYLNMKKPVIGSDVGVNKNIIEGNGIIANTQAEWEQSIEELLFNEYTYKECVKHIENHFFDEYHFSVVARKLVGILECGVDSGNY